MLQRTRTLVALSLFILSAAATADAAAVRSGPTSVAIAALARGNAVAYDSTNRVYLVVSSQGVLYGRFVDAAGNPIGGTFGIQGNPANFAHFPRVTFSPDADGGAGGFLVTWHEGAPSVHGRMVSYGRSGAYGADTQLTGDVSWWEAGAAVAYSTASREFLVVWRSMPVKGGAPFNDIHAVRVDNNAAAAGPVFAVTNDVHYQDNPSVAYNPASNEFLVVYAGYNDSGGFAFADAQRVQPGSGALLGAATRLVTTGGVYITDVTYNSSTGRFLASWYSLPSGAALARNVNPDGSLSGDIITLSTRWKAYDALSVAYNAVTNTFFMVSHGTTAEDGGVELNSGGAPVDNGFETTAAGGKGNFYPRIAASTNDPKWLVSTANNFTSTMVQVLAGSGSGNPAPAPVPAPPASAVSNPMFVIDTPAANGTFSSAGFLISGWAVDTGSNSGPGIDAVVCWAFPSNGAAAMLAGVAYTGHPRPDVGAWLGPNFGTSGYGMLGVLPPGTYTLAVYAHSTVSGLWGTPKTVSAIVNAAVSAPRMWLDTPTNGMQVATTFGVAGWAIDLAAGAGTGVDTVHVWAFPSNGAAAVFLGVPQTGFARPDVAKFYGASSQFNNSGFGLIATLPVGDYTVVAFAHSAVTGTFNNTATATIRVR